MVSSKSCACILAATALLGWSMDSAAGSLSKAPKSIRQIYEDGTFTEIMCGSDLTRFRSRACSFKVSTNGKAKIYQFKIDSLGYHDTVDSYSFFEGSNSDDFSITFPVTCSDKDLSLLNGVDGENAKCRLYLKVEGHCLRPTLVDVQSKRDVGYQSGTRKFESLLEEKCTKKPVPE